MVSSRCCFNAYDRYGHTEQALRTHRAITTCAIPLHRASATYIPSKHYVCNSFAPRKRYGHTEQALTCHCIYVRLSTFLTAYRHHTSARPAGINLSQIGVQGRLVFCGFRPAACNPKTPSDCSRGSQVRAAPRHPGNRSALAEPAGPSTDPCSPPPFAPQPTAKRPLSASEDVSPPLLATPPPFR